MGFSLAGLFLSRPPALVHIQCAGQWRRAEQQKRLADANFRHAHQAIRGMHDVIMLEKRLANPGFEELHHEVLRLSLKYYQQLGQSSDGNYELDEDTADTCYRLSSFVAGRG